MLCGHSERTDSSPPPVADSGPMVFSFGLPMPVMSLTRLTRNSMTSYSLLCFIRSVFTWKRPVHSCQMVTRGTVDWGWAGGQQQTRTAVCKAGATLGRVCNSSNDGTSDWNRPLLTAWKLLMMIVRKMLTKMHVIDMVKVKNIRGPSAGFAF